MSLNTRSRLSKDAYFIGLAKHAALRATCLRRQVGCVLVDHKSHVLATGYNGVPQGFPHCNEMTGFMGNPDLKGHKPEHWEIGTVPKYGHACAGAHAPSGTSLMSCNAIHAEQNALLQCHDVDKIDTCYCTASPCITCLRMLLNTGCQRIVFTEEYPHPESRILWESVGREWIRYGAAS